MEGCVPVTFEPAGVTVWVESGSTVLAAARRAGIVLNAPCGGRGICGGCAVKVLSGDLAGPGDMELAGLERAPAGVRLACHSNVNGPVTVRPVVAVSSTGEAVPGDEGVRPVAGVDLGTTTVSVAIVDAESRRELGTATVPNRQIAWGSDVLSRISSALDGHGEALSDAAWSSIADALQLAGATDSRPVRVVIAANTAMSALLAGADVAPLSVAPFTAPSLPATLVSGVAVASLLAEGAEVGIVPPVSAFVGGDAVAASVATGVIESAEPVFVVDMGTNAEVVLRSSESLFVASAPAGPAFEGGGIRSGGPAAEGGVARVSISSDGSVELEVIGGGDAGWFTGSGLISAVAALRRSGHIDRDGAFVGTGPLSKRFETDEQGVTVLDLGDPAGRLVLSQLDIRAFQLAKAAVCVAVESALKSARLKPRRVRLATVAGAFGAAVEPADLVELGIVPAKLEPVLAVAGRAALTGATAFALDDDLLPRAVGLAGAATHLDLAAEPGFAKHLIDAMRLEPR